MKIYAPLPADGSVQMTPVFFESREDAEAYIQAEDLNAVVTEYKLVPMVFHQEARPFIAFPLDNSVEGWIKVAADLQEMVTYLIEQKVEKVEVKYIDRRLDGEIQDPRDYGLAVILYRDKWPNSKFYDELFKKTGRNNQEPTG